MRGPMVAAVTVLVGLGMVLLSGQVSAADGDPLSDFVPEGFGADARGGEGGRVIRVTNLNDSGPGSLREALSMDEPRIVTFQVGGIIDLDLPIEVTSGRLTIDGLSAADRGGITLHGRINFRSLACRDVIVRHLRVRRGEPGGDGISLDRGAHRIVLDHCSVSWADDENIGITMAHYVSVQWCIIAEGQIEGEHTKGAHSCGMLVGHGANHVSVHHCFFSGNMDRNALLCGPGGADYAGEEVAIYMPVTTFDYRNNLVYNMRGGTQVAQGTCVNVINNYYRLGPSFTAGYEVHIFSDTTYPGSERPLVYCAGNLGPRRLDQETDDWALVTVDHQVDLESPYRTDRPFLVPAVTTRPATDVPDMVLSHAGAFPRDEVDERLVEEFRTGTGEAGAGYLQWKAAHGL